MHGIRIWHLAALALSVPLLAAAVPSGCTGGLNPNFRKALGQDPGTGIPVPKGYVVLGIFDETGWPGRLNVSVTGHTGWTENWIFPVDPSQPHGYAWECDLQTIDITDGELDVPDATGAIQQETISYNGGTLEGISIGQPLECGTLVKVRIVTITINGTAQYHAFVDIMK